MEARSVGVNDAAYQVEKLGMTFYSLAILAFDCISWCQGRYVARYTCIQI